MAGIAYVLHPFDIGKQKWKGAVAGGWQSQCQVALQEVAANARAAVLLCAVTEALSMLG